MTWPELVRESLLDLAALIVPVTCSGCGAPDRAVCAACVGAFESGEPVRGLAGDLPVFSAAPYGDVVARVIGAFKDGGRTDASPTLARALRQALGAAMLERDPAAGVLLVPVPSSAAAMRRRGYAPVETIARSAGLRVARRLRVRRRVRDQGELDAVSRADNVAGAFVATRPLAGRTCIVIDDVVTTGSTLAEARRALRAAGADVAFAATVAATPLRHAPLQGPRL